MNLIKLTMSRPQSVHIWVNNKGKMYILNSAYSFNISLQYINVTQVNSMEQKVIDIRVNKNLNNFRIVPGL